MGNLSPAIEIPLQAVVTRQLRLQGSCAIAGEYPAALSMIERGARSAPVETLFELALALGVPLSELVRLEDGPSAPDPAFAQLAAFAAERRLRRPQLARLLLVVRALLDR